MFKSPAWFQGYISTGTGFAFLTAVALAEIKPVSMCDYFLIIKQMIDYVEDKSTDKSAIQETVSTEAFKKV